MHFYRIFLGPAFPNQQIILNQILSGVSRRVGLWIMGVIIYITELLGKTKCIVFFTILGKNPLFIYLVSELGVSLLHFIPGSGDNSLYETIYENVYKHLGLYFGSLLFAISWMLVCWLVGYWLDKRKIYVRV
jgi:predicted acyltransferase